MKTTVKLILLLICASWAFVIVLFVYLSNKDLKVRQNEEKSVVSETNPEYCFQEGDSVEDWSNDKIYIFKRRHLEQIYNLTIKEDENN
jgi:hypothetical protein